MAWQRPTGNIGDDLASSVLNCHQVLQVQGIYSCRLLDIKENPI